MFDMLITRQIGMGGAAGYALGWAVAVWQGHVLIAHTGGIDGFNAFVAFMPERKVGYVLLTNVSGSATDAAVGPLIWSTFADPQARAATSMASAAGTSPATAPAVDPMQEVGKYSFAEAGMDIEIMWKPEPNPLVG